MPSERKKAFRDVARRGDEPLIRVRVRPLLGEREHARSELDRRPGERLVELPIRTYRASRNPTEARGFAALSPEQRRDIARRGGKAAHARGVAHKFTTAEARVAGSKGGAACATKPGYMSAIGKRGGSAVSEDGSWMSQIGRKGGSAVSVDREHMATIGRKGGRVPKTARTEG